MDCHLPILAGDLSPWRTLAGRLLKIILRSNRIWYVAPDDEQSLYSDESLNVWSVTCLPHVVMLGYKLIFFNSLIHPLSISCLPRQYLYIFVWQEYANTLVKRYLKTEMCKICKLKITFTDFLYSVHNWLGKCKLY